VIVRHDDIPAIDITTDDGIPCTTALRTVIDLAPEVEPKHLEEMVQDCVDRRLFTVDEAWRRLAQHVMATRPGAEHDPACSPKIELIRLRREMRATGSPVNPKIALQG
jgi:hypothetical protein